MSTLYLGTDSETLAGKLAELLQAKDRDPFIPVTIVLPNRYLGKWLKLWLARRLGLAFNLRFLYLENALWEWLRSVDPRSHPSEPELLDHDSYRLMVLALLWEENAGPELAAVQGYVQRASRAARASWRRSWHLADRLARFIRDYEYHRQDALIQHWLKGELGYPQESPSTIRLERSQREIFQRITRLPDGKRALLEQATGRVLKTLPQYAMEVMECVGPASLAEKREMVHLFAITQISELHIRTLHWLSGHRDVRLYHLNPVSRVANASGPDSRLIESWGKAGAESYYLAAQLLTPPNPFHREYLASSRKETPTVLGRLHEHLCATGDQPVSDPVPQDASLQIVSCPGIYREVETVYQSILHNLQISPKLKQTDIGVLVTDLGKYRPVLQAVFEREPRRLHYNLANFSAAGLSVFGQALVGFLDLALESFTREQVFAVLLNPCVLAKLGVDRRQALTWLTWAQQLGIYHGWDRPDKEERGYPATRQFSWRLGLQRLRLGRIMEAAGEDNDTPAPRFQDVIPYADLASGDKAELNAFCRAVEGLLPCLAKLRNFQGTAAQWAGEVRRLVQHFLAVPEDLPEEEQVRDRLALSLAQLANLDRLQAPGAPPLKLPLALVREFVQENLEALEGIKGEVLTGGVTIAPMPSLRYVPFRILYILGLGEDLFPGSNAIPSFDLRACERRPGDIHPAENNRFLFLESLLAARDKVYLLYTGRDLERDQELQPAVPLTQLRRYLEDHVVGQKFEIARVPLSGWDGKYLETASAASDILVNYNESERLLALEEARSQGILALDDRGLAELTRRRQKARPAFQMPAGPGRPAQTLVPTITLGELKRFLLCPAEACLRRHLHVQEEKEFDTQDNEPFWTDALGEHELVTATLERFVLRAVRAGVEAARGEWRAGFGQRYEEWGLRSRAPEGAFAEVDRAGLEATLEERISGSGGLADFLQRRQADSFAGPILLGESPTPVGALWHFPALTLDIGANLYFPSQARLVGACRLAWRTPKAFEILILTNKKPDKNIQTELSKHLLEPVLFWLALRAGREAGPLGLSSAQWLEDLPLRVHLTHQEGIASFAYPGNMSGDKARTYLTGLAADLLNPNSFDLLPFEVLVQFEEFRNAYQIEDKDFWKGSRSYQRRLQDFLDQDREKEGFSQYRWTPLLELAKAKVPADALSKVRRRFRILDIGPKRNRKRAQARSASEEVS